MKISDCSRTLWVHLGGVGKLEASQVLKLYSRFFIYCLLPHFIIPTLHVLPVYLSMYLIHTHKIMEVASIWPELKSEPHFLCLV